MDEYSNIQPANLETSEESEVKLDLSWSQQLMIEPTSTQKHVSLEFLPLEECDESIGNASSVVDGYVPVTKIWIMIGLIGLIQ